MSLLNKVNSIRSLEYESNVKHGLGLVGEDCLAGIFSSFTHSWLACGPQLFIINNSDGSLLCSWTFGEQSPEQFDITCVVELQMEGCSIPLLIVGISSENVNQICFFNPNTRKIIRAIDINYPVRTLCIIEDGLNEVNPINNALTKTQGLFVGGCADGSLLLFDLCRGILLKALNADFGFISEEDNPVETVILDLNAVSTSTVQQKLKECYTKQNNFAVLLKGSSEEGVTSLHYSFESAILFFGTSSGSFVLWNMSSLDCVFRSQQTGRAVTSLSLLEPCDDPRHNLFLWICYEDHPQAVMYCISFSSKYYVPGYGVYYQGFESAGPVYRLILGVDENLVAKRAVNSQSVARAVSKNISKNSNLLDGDSYQIRLFVTSYEVNNKGQISNRAVVFDLNQWYKEQMPDEGVSLCLDTVALSGNTMWHLALEPSSVSHYQWVRPLEQHFHPSSLDFRIWCIEEEGINCFEKLGLQSQWLRNVSVVGPSALLSPTQLFHGALSAGLLPMFDDPPDPDSVTVEEERMYILTVCLENRAVSVIELCAREWSSGGHPVAGCTLAFLTSWLWSLHGSYKNHGNRMCVPLFDQSGLVFDVSERKALQHCKSLLCTVEALYTNIVKNYSTYVFVDGMEQKLTAMSLVRFYFDCCLKLISAKLLPEPNDAGRPVGSIIYKFDEINNYVNSKRKEGPFLGDSLLGKTGGELEWEEEGGAGRYPPPSIQSALRYCLHPAPPLSNKLSLLLYLYMDILHFNKPLRDQSNFEDVKNFQYLLRIPDVQYKVVTSFWFLDHSLFDEGISLLLDPRVLPVDLTDDQHRNILSLLALQRQEKLGLQYLRLKAPALHQPNDIRLELELLLANRLINEAFMFQRKHPELRESLLIQFFKGCIAKKLLGLVFGLHLDPKEEAVLLKFLKSSDLKEKGDLQVLLLLSRAKYTEAISLNERLNSMSNGPRARLETDTRDMIVRGVTGGLNTISRKLAYEMKQYRPPPPGTCPKPLSALIKIRNEPDGPLCQADSNALLSAAASSIRHLSDFVNSDGGKRKRTSSVRDDYMDIDFDDPPRKRIAISTGDNGIVRHIASSFGPSLTPIKSAASRQEREVMELVGTPLVKKRGKRFSPLSKPSSILKGKTPEKGFAAVDDQGDTPRKTLRFTLPNNENRVAGRKSIHMKSSTLSNSVEKLNEESNVKKLREQLKSDGNLSILGDGGINWKDIAESSKPQILFSQGTNKTPRSQSKHTLLDITISSAERKYLDSPTREREATLNTEAVFSTTIPKVLFTTDEDALDIENELEDINERYLNKESVLDEYKRLRQKQINGNNSEAILSKKFEHEENVEEYSNRKEKSATDTEERDHNVESKPQVSFSQGTTRTPLSLSRHTFLDITISSVEKKYLESPARESEPSPVTEAIFNTTIAKRLFTTDEDSGDKLGNKMETRLGRQKRLRQSQIDDLNKEETLYKKVTSKNVSYIDQNSCDQNETNLEEFKDNNEKNVTETEEREVPNECSDGENRRSMELNSECKSIDNVENDENQDDKQEPMPAFTSVECLEENETESANKEPTVLIESVLSLNNSSLNFSNVSDEVGEDEEQYSNHESTVHIESVLSLNSSSLNLSNASDEVTSSANDQVTEETKEDDLEQETKSDEEDYEEREYSSPEYDSDSIALEYAEDSEDSEEDHEDKDQLQSRQRHCYKPIRSAKANSQEAVICLDSDSNDEETKESRVEAGDISLDYDEDDHDEDEISDSDVFGIGKYNDKSEDKSKKNNEEESELDDVYNFSDDEAENKETADSDEESVVKDDSSNSKDEKITSKDEEPNHDDEEQSESSNEDVVPADSHNIDEEVASLEDSCHGEAIVDSNESENVISGDDDDENEESDEDEYPVRTFGQNAVLIRSDSNDSIGSSFVPVKVASKYEQKCERSFENKDPLAAKSEEVSSTSEIINDIPEELVTAGVSSRKDKKSELSEQKDKMVKLLSVDGKDIPIFSVPEEHMKQLSKIKYPPEEESSVKTENLPNVSADKKENNADIIQIESEIKQIESTPEETFTEPNAVSQEHATTLTTEHSNDSTNEEVSISASEIILPESCQNDGSSNKTINLPDNSANKEENNKYLNSTNITKIESQNQHNESTRKEALTEEPSTVSQEHGTALATEHSNDSMINEIGFSASEIILPESCQKDDSSDKTTNLPDISTNEEENNADSNSTNMNKMESQSKQKESALKEAFAEPKKDSHATSTRTMDHSNDPANKELSIFVPEEDPRQKETAGKLLTPQVENKRGNEKLAEQHCSVVSSDSVTSQAELKNSESSVNALENINEVQESFTTREVNVANLSNELASSSKNNVGKLESFDQKAREASLRDDKSNRELKTSNKTLEECGNVSERSQVTSLVKLNEISSSENVTSLSSGSTITDTPICEKKEETVISRKSIEETPLKKSSVIPVETIDSQDPSNKSRNVTCEMITSSETIISFAKEGANNSNEAVKESQEEHVTPNVLCSQQTGNEAVELEKSTQLCEPCEVIDSSMPVESRTAINDSQQISDDASIKSLKEKALTQTIFVENTEREIYANSSQAPVTCGKESIASSGNNVPTLVSSSTDNEENNIKQSNSLMDDKTGASALDVSEPHVQLVDTNSSTCENKEGPRLVITDLPEKQQDIQSNENKHSSGIVESSSSTPEIEKEPLVENKTSQPLEGNAICEELVHTQKVSSGDCSEDICSNKSGRKPQSVLAEGRAEILETVVSSHTTNETNTKESTTECQTNTMEIESCSFVVKDNEPLIVEKKSLEQMETLDSEILSQSTKVESVSCSLVKSAPAIEANTLDKNVLQTTKKTCLEKEKLVGDKTILPVQDVSDKTVKVVADKNVVDIGTIEVADKITPNASVSCTVIDTKSSIEEANTTIHSNESLKKVEHVPGESSKMSGDGAVVTAMALDNITNSIERKKNIIIPSTSESSTIPEGSRLPSEDCVSAVPLSSNINIPDSTRTITSVEIQSQNIKCTSTEEQPNQGRNISSEPSSEVIPCGLSGNKEKNESSGCSKQNKSDEDGASKTSDNLKKNVSEKTFFFGNNDSETFLRASKATFQVGSRASLPAEDESINPMEIAMIEEGGASEEDEETDPRNTCMLDADFSLHLSEDETIKTVNPKKVDKSMMTKDSYLSRKTRSSRLSELGASKDQKSKSFSPTESSIQANVHQVSKQKVNLCDEITSDKRCLSTQTDCFSDEVKTLNTDDAKLSEPRSSASHKSSSTKQTSSSSTNLEIKNTDKNNIDDESGGRVTSSRKSTRTSEIKGILKTKGRQSSQNSDYAKDLRVQGPESSNENISDSDAEAIIRNRALKSQYKSNVEDRDVRTDPYEIVDNVQKNVSEKRHRRSSVNSLNSDDAKDLRIKQDDFPEETRRSRRLSKEPEIQGILKKPGESKRRSSHSSHNEKEDKKSSRHSQLLGQEDTSRDEEDLQDIHKRSKDTRLNDTEEKRISSRQSMEPEIRGILKNKDNKSSRRSCSSETSIDLKKRLKEDFPEPNRRSRRYSEEPELQTILKRSENLSRKGRSVQSAERASQEHEAEFKEQVEEKRTHRRHSVHDYQDVPTREGGRRKKSSSSHTSDTATDLRIRLDKDFSEEKSRSRRKSEEPEIRSILKNKEEPSRRRTSSQASDLPSDLGINSDEELTRERRRSRRKSIDSQQTDIIDTRTISGRRSRRLSNSSEASDIKTSCDDLSENRNHSRKSMLLNRYKEDEGRQIDKSSVCSDQATDLRLRIEEDFPDDAERKLKDYESKRSRRASLSSEGSTEKAVVSKRQRHSLGTDFHREPRTKHTRSSLGPYPTSHNMEDDTSDDSSKTARAHEKSGRSTNRGKRSSSKEPEDLSPSEEKKRKHSSGKESDILKNIIDLSAEQSSVQRKKSRSLQDFPIRRSTRLLHPILEDIREEDEETPRKKRRSLDDLDAAKFKKTKPVSRKKDEPKVIPNLVVVESDSEFEDSPVMESVMSIEGYAKERRLTRNQKKVFIKNQLIAEATPSPSSSSSPAKRLSRKKTPAPESPVKTPTRSSLRLQRMPPSESD